jgi:hypothetical protein
MRPSRQTVSAEAPRQCEGEKEVRVFDYVDGAVPVLRRMFDKRLKGYRATGYEKGELPDGFELLAEPEYDEGGWDVDLETTENRDHE